MPESIATLRNKIIAWFGMEDDPTLARAVDSHAGYILTNPSSPSYLARRAGVVGYGLEAGEEPDYLKSRNIPYLKIPSGNFAVAMWFQFRAPPPIGNRSIAMHQTGPDATADNIKVTLDSGGANIITGTVDIRGDSNPTFQYTNAAQWYFLTFNYRDIWSKNFYYNGILDIRTSDMMDAGQRTTHRVESNYPFSKDGFLTLFAKEDGSQEFGSKAYLVLDEVVLFNEPLTDAEQEWIYNAGSGRAYSEVPPAAAATEECAKSIECCDKDDFSYVSGGKEITSTARNELGKAPPGAIECDENPVVYSIPETGSCAFFPVQVQLFCDTLNVELYYTTDGSDPELSEQGSTQLWDGTPITLNGPLEQIRVRPVVSGCPTYPVRDIQFNTCFPFELTWLCSNTDKVGSWGVWAPDGNDDQNWTLRMELPGNTEIKRIEIYELDEDMHWTTGQAWATDNPIYPFPTDPSYEFSVYPLSVEDTGVPLETDYVDSLGVFSGSIDWDLFGDIRVATPNDHYFQIKIFTEEYGILEQILSTSSCEAPIVIYPTVELTLTPQCSNCDASIDWEFTVPALGAGGSYEVSRRRICFAETETTVIASGSGAVPGLVSGSDDPLPEYCAVEYHLRFTFASGAISDHVISANTFGCPSILLNAEVDDLVPGSTFRVRVRSQNVESGGACGAQVPVLLNGNPWFTADANTDKWYDKDVDDLAEGTNSICVTACNTCGSSNQVCIEFEYNSPASCVDFTQPAVIYEIEGWQNTEDFGWGVLGGCGVQGFELPWDGGFAQPGGFGCQFNGTSDPAYIIDDDGIYHAISAVIQFYDSQIGAPFPPGTTGWVLGIVCRSYFGTVFWMGVKTTGNTPAGSYTAQASLVIGATTFTPQSVTPATITLVER